jgi:hypothetical protein
MKTCNSALLLTAAALGCALSLNTPAAAQDVWTSRCVHTQESGVLRKVGARAETGFWIASNGERADVCIWLGHCAWAFKGVLPQDLGLLSRYADARFKCGSDFHWEGRGEARVQRDDCTADVDVSAALASLRQTLHMIVKDQDKTCTIVGDAPTSGLALPGGGGRSPALVLPVPIYWGQSSNQKLTRACANLVLQPANLSRGALLTPACDATGPLGDQVRGVVSHLPTDRANWLASSPADGGVGFGLILPDVALRGSPGLPHPFAWGDLNERYVTAWLGSVWQSAVTDHTNAPLPEVDDPLPNSDGTSAIGRVSKWMVAGMRRTMPSGPGAEDHALSKAARDWMARTLTSDPAVFAHTLLRQEAARPNLVKP